MPKITACHYLNNNLITDIVKSLIPACPVKFFGEKELAKLNFYPVKQVFFYLTGAWQ